MCTKGTQHNRRSLAVASWKRRLFQYFITFCYCRKIKHWNNERNKENRHIVFLFFFFFFVQLFWLFDWRDCKLWALSVLKYLGIIWVHFWCADDGSPARRTENRGWWRVTGDRVVVNNCVSQACYSFINVHPFLSYFLFHLIFGFIHTRPLSRVGLCYSHNTHFINVSSFCPVFGFHSFRHSSKITNDTWTYFLVFSSDELTFVDLQRPTIR